MDNPEEPLRDVYVVGVGMPRFGRFPDLSVRSLAEEAVGLALADAGAAHADIETITFGAMRSPREIYLRKFCRIFPRMISRKRL